MASSRSVQKELESLRSEIAGLRQDYARLKSRASASKSEATDRVGAIRSDLAETIDAIKESLTEGTGAAAEEIATRFNDLRNLANEYSDKTEKTVSAHPLATVAGAVLLGYMIGRFRR